MIKLKDELVNFPTIDLEALSKSNSFPENVKTAVSLYNKAIDRIKFNSSDIAMIELKKAIKMFPEFYDAILLLSLCHYANEEKSKAISLLNTIKDEEERTKCFRYLDSVVGKSVSGVKSIRRPESAAQKQVQRTSRTMPSERKTPQRSKAAEHSFKVKVLKLFTSPFMFRGIVMLFILLLVIGLGVGIYTLYNVNKQANIENARIADLESKYNTEVTQKGDLLKDLKNLRTTQEELISQHLEPWILELYTEKSAKSYEKIVQVMYLLDLKVLSDEELKTKLTNIQTEARDHFAANTYSAAQSDIQQGKLKEAAAAMEKIIKYHENFATIPEVKLELGKAYKEDNRTDKAIEILEGLIQSHPQSAQVTEAKNLLNQLKESN